MKGAMAKAKAGQVAEGGISHLLELFAQSCMLPQENMAVHVDRKGYTHGFDSKVVLAASHLHTELLNMGWHEGCCASAGSDFCH